MKFMKWTGYLLAVYWLATLVGLFFGYDPHISTVGAAFFLSALSMYEIGQKYD